MVFALFPIYIAGGQQIEMYTRRSLQERSRSSPAVSFLDSQMRRPLMEVV